MHALLILLFIGWQIATWTGDPSNTPAHLMTLLVVVSCIAIFDQLTPFLKAALIGQGFKPSRKRKLAAVLFSAACVAAALVLNLYSRAFFGFYPDLPTYLDYQRTLMVMSYWATSCAPPRPPWPHSSAAPSAPVHTPALGPVHRDAFRIFAGWCTCKRLDSSWASCYSYSPSLAASLASAATAAATGRCFVDGRNDRPLHALRRPRQRPMSSTAGAPPRSQCAVSQHSYPRPSQANALACVTIVS